MPAVPPTVYVRLEPLVRAHPLYAEVLRLKKTEDGLGVVPPVPVPFDAASTVAVLRPLQTQTGPNDLRAAQNALTRIDERQQDEQNRLRRIARRGLDAYARASSERQQRLIEQKRAEVAARLAARDARNERENRERIKSDVTASVEALANQKTEIQARLAVLDAQLGPGSVFLAPVLDREALEKEIQTLEANPNALGIGTRAYLELRRRRNEALIRDINTKIAQAIAAGNAQIARLAEEVQQKRAGEIEASLDDLRSDTEIKATRSREARALIALLKAQEATTARATLPLAGGSGAGALQIAGKLAGGAQTRPEVGQAAAVARIAKQRQALEALITESVADSVRDVGQTQGVQVRLVGSVVGGQSRIPPGATDATNQFAGWLRAQAGRVPRALMGGNQRKGAGT